MDKVNACGNKVNILGAEIECIRSMLEEHGITYTQQREEILSLFIAAPKHYKPDEVFKLLRCKGIGIATVYRTLEMLKECNIIKEISVGKDRFYELKKPDSKHVYIHFRCNKCGNLRDYFDIDTIKNHALVFESVEKKLNVNIKDVSITVNGLCSKCKE